MYIYITLHYIILHYITLHYITLHYITYYITLHYRNTYIHIDRTVSEVSQFIYVKPLCLNGLCGPCSSECCGHF